MHKDREYVWKCQSRESEEGQWEDMELFPDLSPGMIRVHLDNHTNYGFNIPERKRNSFIVRDGAPIPDIVHRIASPPPSQHYMMRTILESVDDNGKPLIRVVSEYPKLTSSKDIHTDDGIPYAICKYEDCGEKIVPDRRLQHLVQKHGFRQKVAMKFAHTDSKYFDIVIEHGEKAKEGVSVKALRKGKV